MECGGDTDVPCTICPNQSNNFNHGHILKSIRLRDKIKDLPMISNIKHPMQSQMPLLAALVNASTWTQTSDIAEALEAYAKHPENCK